MRSLVLASQSPRRRTLLERQGYSFHTLSIEISEILKENLNLDDAIMDIASQKARALIDSGKLSEIKNYLVLSGDTVVVLEDEVLGKPKNEQNAYSHLRKLSGITHCVKTSVCFYDSVSEETVLDIETSQVTFNELSDDQIWEYIKTGDPMDKAGAYGIQTVERNFIKEISGSVDNVMGLPVELVNNIIKQKGWPVDRKQP